MTESASEQAFSYKSSCVILEEKHEVIDVKIEKITREAEAALPRFRSHREARLWLKLRYGDAFELEESFVVGDDEMICYRYSLVLDREVYEKGVRQLVQGSMSDAGDFLASYQAIEVMLDGSVHVIH